MSSFFKSFGTIIQQAAAGSLNRALDGSRLGRLAKLGAKTLGGPEINKFLNALQTKSVIKSSPTFSEIALKALAKTDQPVSIRLLKTINAIQKGINLFGKVQRGVTTAREFNANPLAPLMSFLGSKAMAELDSFRVPIRKGRVVGVYSQDRLKLSFLIDQVSFRKGRAVDLEAYFKNPVTKLNGKYVEVPSTTLDRAEVTSSTPMYIGSLLARKLIARQNLFSLKGLKGLEATIKDSADVNVKERWRKLFTDVRRWYKGQTRDAARALADGTINEQEYIERVSKAYERSRRLITLLSAGGIGKLSEDGLGKIELRIKEGKTDLIETLKDNIDRYRRTIQDERINRGDAYEVREKTRKAVNVEKAKKQLDRIIRDSSKAATDKDSKLNKILSKRSKSNPRAFITNSVKQSKVRRALKNMISNFENPQSALNKLFSDVQLTNETESEVSEVFRDEYSQLLKKLRGVDGAEDIVISMEESLASDRNRGMDFTEENRFQDFWQLDRAADEIDTTIEDVQHTAEDILNEIADDNNLIEESHRDGTEAELEETRKDLPKNQKVYYYRVTTHQDRCDECVNNAFEPFDTYEEARNLDHDCLNVVHHGGVCYCEIKIITETSDTSTEDATVIGEI